MISYGKFITSVFIFTLFICQGGVCSTLTNTLPKADNSPKSHNCHNMIDDSSMNNDSDGFNFTKLDEAKNSSDCCFDGTMNSRDTGPDVIQTPVTIAYTDHEETFKNPVKLNRTTKNKGHPPGIPAFIQKSSLII